MRTRPPQAGDRRHIPLLDGMRGYAALAVVLTHMMEFFQHSLPVEAGILAVDLFFVMSGVVIEKSYGEALRSGDMTFAQFVQKRLVRLYPLYIFAAVIGLLVYARHLPGGGTGHGLAATVASVVLMLPQFLFGIPETFGFNNASWSLSIELYGGFAFALLARRSGSAWLVLIAGAALGCLWYGVTTNGTLNLGPFPQNFHFGIARFAFSYPVGMLIWRHRERLQMPQTLAIAILIGAMFFPNLPGNNGLRLAWIASALPLGVIAAINITAAPRLDAVCAFLGRISYPVYIIHVPVLALFVGLLSKIWGDRVWHDPLAGTATLLVILVATLITSAWLEAPLRRAFTALLDCLVNRAKWAATIA